MRCIGTISPDELVYPTGPMEYDKDGSLMIPIEGGGYIFRFLVQPARDEDFFPGAFGTNPNMKVYEIGSDKTHKVRPHQSSRYHASIRASLTFLWMFFFFHWVYAIDVLGEGGNDSHCLVDSLRALGLPVTPYAKGPFWALADGNVFLHPYGLELTPVPRSCLHERGKYVLFKDGHFTSLSHHPDYLEGALLHVDGCTFFLTQKGLESVVADSGVIVFSLVPREGSAYQTHTTLWSRESDVCGGMRAAASSQLPPTPHQTHFQVPNAIDELHAQVLTVDGTVRDDLKIVKEQHRPSQTLDAAMKDLMEKSTQRSVGTQTRSMTPLA